MDAEFCGRIAGLQVARPLWVQESKDAILRSWNDHLPFHGLGLEEAIIRHFGHGEFVEAISPRRRSRLRLPDNEYLDQLSHLISFVLRRAKERSDGPYEQFSRKVFPRRVSANLATDRVVTFNYDDLLDRHLLKRFPIERLYFDRIKRTKEQSDRRKITFDFPFLIKLHGSVNWRCTTEEFKKIANGFADRSTLYFIPSIWFSEKGTPSPEADSSPLIMPPIPKKPITDMSLFCFLWTRAFEYLHEARELVICGYSLPHTDQLAQSMFANFANNKLKRVTIVDKNPDMLRKWRTLLRRPNVNQGAQY